MEQYLTLLRHVKSEGIKKEDRTGIGTLSVFGYQMRFDLNEGFPLVTTKEIPLKSIIYELLWFLQGDTNIKYLPAKESSVVTLGPFVDIGSLTICIRIYSPLSKTSLIFPNLFISSVFLKELKDGDLPLPLVFLTNDLSDKNWGPKSK